MQLPEGHSVSVDETQLPEGNSDPVGEMQFPVYLYNILSIGFKFLLLVYPHL